VTLPAPAVHDVLKAVVPFAGKDTTLPMLCAVQLDTIDGYLVAAATNRYVVGRSRAKLTEGEWAGPFLMTMVDAKRFLGAAKDAAAVILPCILSVDEGARTLSLHTEQATLNAAELDEEFPKVARAMRILPERAPRPVPLGDVRPPDRRASTTGVAGPPGKPVRQSLRLRRTDARARARLGKDRPRSGAGPGRAHRMRRHHRHRRSP